MRRETEVYIGRAHVSGFTLLELLVVASVTVILVGLLLPGITAAKSRSRTTICSSNLKQFNIALFLYAGDHDDGILPNADGEGLRLGETWVEGWLGIHGPDATNSLLLSRSLIGEYIADTRIWRCPASRDVHLGGRSLPRVRTVSLNAFMGSPVEVAHAKVFRKLSEINPLAPAEALTFLDERHDTINDASFAMQWRFVAEVPELWELRDKPSAMHSQGGNVAFADGHVTLQRWQDARTRKAPRDDLVMPNNFDVRWLQEHATWREPSIRKP